MLNSKDMKTSSKILSTIIAVAILSTSAVTVFAKDNKLPEPTYTNIPSDIAIVDNSSTFEESVVAENAPFAVEGYTVYMEPDDGKSTIAEIADIVPLATYSYNWKVSSNSGTSGSTSYYLRKDDICEASAVWAEPKAGTVKIGFTSGTTFYYISGSNGSINGTLKMTVSGDYKFRVKNEGSENINISGFYTV